MVTAVRPQLRDATRLRLGDLLLAAQMITEAQLDDALAEHFETREPLGRVLVRRQLLTAADVLRVVANQLGVEFVDLDDIVVDPIALTGVSERFARRHLVLPIGVRDESLLVAMANPRDVFARDDLGAITHRPVKAVLADDEQLRSAIDRIWSSSAGEEAIELITDDLQEEAPELSSSTQVDDGPVVQFVNQLLARAVSEHASDVHLEPNERELTVRFRIDGVLRDVMSVPRAAQPSIISRVKIMAELDIAERRLPQDGRITVSVGGRTLSLRVVTLPTSWGEAIVLRVLDEATDLLELGSLGFAPRALAQLVAAARKPWGMILVTGPTGAGKSTTLYSLLQQLNDRDRNIVTVEDPVEYRLAGIKQVQVNRKAGLGFPNALRSILRADPDIVLVGEIRDRETAAIAADAALTGHLLLSTLHTNDAASSPARLLDMGVEPFVTASAVTCVVAQRLARRLCDRCKDARPATEDELVEFGLDDVALESVEWPASFRPVGCGACGGTGYNGRVALQEVMPVSEDIAQLITLRRRSGEIRAQAVTEGMRTLQEDAFAKAAAGLTSLSEVARSVG